MIEIKQKIKSSLHFCFEGILGIPSSQILYHKNHTPIFLNDLLPYAPHELANSFLQNHILHIYRFSSISLNYSFKYVTSITSYAFECFVAKTA